MIPFVEISPIPSKSSAFSRERQIEELGAMLDQKEACSSEDQGLLSPSSSSDVTYVDHALLRMAEPSPSGITELVEKARERHLLDDPSKFADFVTPRGITRDQILATIKHGEHIQQFNGRVMHKGSDITVITDSTLEVVITTFRNRQPKSKHSSSKDISFESKEQLRRSVKEMGTDASFSPNIKRAVNRIRKDEGKAKDVERKKAREKRVPRY